AGIENLGGIALVVADDKRQTGSSYFAEVKNQRRPLGVSGHIFGRVTDRDQTLLQHPPKRRIDQIADSVEPFAEILPHLGLPRQFFEKRLVRAHEAKFLACFFEAHSAVAADLFRNVGGEITGKREFAVTMKDRYHLLSG